MGLRASLAAVFAVTVLAGCSDTAQFETRYAPGFRVDGHTVSVLGVYKDGRMSSDAWEQIGPTFTAPLGATCPSGYGSLVAAKADLSQAIDDYARANGIDDDLLGQLAPAATGDLILVVTVAGRPGESGDDRPDPAMVAGAPPSTAATNYRGPRPGGGSVGVRGRSGIPNGEAFEMSASLYSVAERRSVGLVSMAYTGKSADEAIGRLAARFGAELPRSRCGGWNWGVPLDEHRIRELER